MVTAAAPCRICTGFPGWLDHPPAKGFEDSGIQAHAGARCKHQSFSEMSTERKYDALSSG